MDALGLRLPLGLVPVRVPTTFAGNGEAGNGEAGDTDSMDFVDTHPLLSVSSPRTFPRQRPIFPTQRRRKSSENLREPLKRPHGRSTSLSPMDLRSPTRLQYIVTPKSGTSPNSIPRSPTKSSATSKAAQLLGLDDSELLSAAARDQNPQDYPVPQRKPSTPKAKRKFSYGKPKSPAPAQDTGLTTSQVQSGRKPSITLDAALIKQLLPEPILTSPPSTSISVVSTPTTPNKFISLYGAPRRKSSSKSENVPLDLPKDLPRPLGLARPTDDPPSRLGTPPTPFASNEISRTLSNIEEVSPEITSSSSDKEISRARRSSIDSHPRRYSDVSTTSSASSIMVLSPARSRTSSGSNRRRSSVPVNRFPRKTLSATIAGRTSDNMRRTCKNPDFKFRKSSLEKHDDRCQIQNVPSIEDIFTEVEINTGNSRSAPASPVVPKHPKIPVHPRKPKLPPAPEVSETPRWLM